MIAGIGPALAAGDLNTYKNVQFAFEVSYPQGWSAREEPLGVRVRNYVNITQQPETPIEIVISCYQNDNPGELGLDGYIAAKSSHIFDEADKKQNLTIGGQPAVKFILGSPRSGFKDHDHYVIRGRDIINIQYSLPDGFDDASVLGVIATLKFVPFDRGAYDRLVQKENNELAGVDADHDGVWDDIQQWIDQNYSNDPNVRTSLRLMAQEAQFRFMNARNRELIIKHSHETFGIECLFKAAPKDSDKILGMFTVMIKNNNARFEADLTADVQTGGQMYTSPDQKTLAAYCGF